MKVDTYAKILTSVSSSDVCRAEKSARSGCSTDHTPPGCQLEQEPVLDSMTSLKSSGDVKENLPPTATASPKPAMHVSVSPLKLDAVCPPLPSMAAEKFAYIRLSSFAITRPE